VTPHRALAVLAATAALLMTPGTVATAATAAPAAVPGPVVLVAVPDLRWSDVTATGTPQLWSLARSGAIGALTVKTDRQVAGCADGLLTLAAGDRRQAEPAGARCTTAAPDRPTALAAALAADRVPVLTRGPGAEALLAGAPPAAPDLPAGVTLVVDDTLLAAPGPGRAGAVTDLDSRIGALTTALRGTGTLLVVGSSDGPGPGGRDRHAHLHVAIAHGPGFPAGLLDSPSTRRSPYVELVDVAPTVLALLDRPVPAAMTGRGWRPVADGSPVADRVARLADLDVRAVRVAAWRPPFQWALAMAALLAGLAALALLAGRLPAGSRGLMAPACYAVAALPLASWLLQPVPWWRGPGVRAGLLLCLLLLGLAAAVGAAATLLARRHPLLGLWTVTGATAAVLLGDLVTGSRLQSASLLGDSPLTAGRFYGAGNTASGALAAATLLAVGTLAGALARSVAIPLAAVTLLVVIGVDGAPTLGADFGGVLALGPAALVLLLTLAGVRLSPARWLAVLAAGAVPTLLVALWDWSRPPDRRTHIGRFVAQVLDGSAGGVLARKETANLGQLTGSPYLPLLVGGLLVAAALLVRRPKWALVAGERLTAVPGMPAALLGLAVAGVIGTLLNDSGIAVAGIMASVAIPALAAPAVRTSPAP
jgi:hypothetical protein